MKQLLSCIIFIFPSMAVLGQLRDKGNIIQRQPPRTQADISVTAVKFENYISHNGPDQIQFPDVYQIDRPATVDSPTVKCSITVHNANDIAASETILMAILPVEVVVISLPANATIHKSGSNGSSPGYITFNLGQMTVGQNITVGFAIIRSKYANKVGAYIYSVTPDPNPGNNYKEASF